MFQNRVGVDITILLDFTCFVITTLVPQDPDTSIMHVKNALIKRNSVLGV